MADHVTRSKVTWHSDDEDDDPLAPIGGAPRPGQNRYNRVVVLKGMFTLSDLERDPALLLELKEDVREECETLGQVTSCTLFDVSPMTRTEPLVLVVPDKLQVGVEEVRLPVCRKRKKES